jgi:hypothetical protein
MSYPQTLVTDAIRGGQEVWRLFTQLGTSGDIYEADASGRALVVGPNSDIARINAVYYDQQNAGLANMLSISTDKPWVGRLDAYVPRKYNSGDQARILLSSIDLVPPPGFVPPSWVAPQPVELVPPFIDLLFYVDEEPSFVPPRADRTHLFEQLPSTAAVPQWFLVPFYGRRFAEVTGKSLGFALQPAVTLSVYGINFSNVLPNAGLADNGHQQELLGSQGFAAPALGAGITDSVTITNRAFDYLAIEIDNGGVAFPDIVSFITHVTVSDRI